MRRRSKIKCSLGFVVEKLTVNMPLKELSVPNARNKVTVKKYIISLKVTINKQYYC